MMSLMSNVNYSLAQDLMPHSKSDLLNKMKGHGFRKRTILLVFVPDFIFLMPQMLEVFENS